MRKDVILELNASLHDALKESSAGAAPDEELALSLLQSLGPPAEMAAQYQPGRVLIGPRLYRPYREWVAVVLGIVTVIFALSLLFGFFTRAGAGKGAGLNEWNPRSLPAVADPDRINRAALIEQRLLKELVLRSITQPQKITLFSL
jgi:hypothetical protein